MFTQRVESKLLAPGVHEERHVVLSVLIYLFVTHCVHLL